MAKDVRTHHWRAVERGQQQGSLTHSLQSMFSIRTTYSDSICYRPDGSCARQHCALRVIQERGPYTLHTQTVPLAQHSLVHPRKNSVRRHFTSGYFIVGWERMTFQLLQSDISGSSGSTYPVRHAQLQCSLEAPDISDRHFEIFWDILLQIFDV